MTGISSLNGIGLAHCGSGRLWIWVEQLVTSREGEKLRNRQFDVRILQHKDFPFFQAREGQRFLCNGGSRVWKNNDLQSFTLLRFTPPEAMGYQGRAVVIAPDVFAVGDIYELLVMDMHGKAIMCVARPGHNDRPAYLASSVTLLDCAQLTDWRCEEQFNWFTEGFDTQDLKDAKALLDSLESGVLSLVLTLQSREHL